MMIHHLAASSTASTDPLLPSLPEFIYPGRYLDVHLNVTLLCGVGEPHLLDISMSQEL